MSLSCLKFGSHLLCFDKKTITLFLTFKFRLLAGLCGEADTFELIFICLPPAYLQQAGNVPQGNLRSSAGSHSTSISPHSITKLESCWWLISCYLEPIVTVIGQGKGTPRLNRKFIAGQYRDNQPFTQTDYNCDSIVHVVFFSPVIIIPRLYLKNNCTGKSKVPTICGLKLTDWGILIFCCFTPILLTIPPTIHWITSTIAH